MTWPTNETRIGGWPRKPEPRFPTYDSERGWQLPPPPELPGEDRTDDHLGVALVCLLTVSGMALAGIVGAMLWAVS